MQSARMNAIANQPEIRTQETAKQGIGPAARPSQGVVGSEERVSGGVIDLRGFDVCVARAVIQGEDPRLELARLQRPA